MNVSLRQLKGFLLVARLGNFTRAAEQLHITQAGLSAMMRDLEVQFDCRLFDRTTRSVSLTKEGASLVASAEMAVNQLELARTSVKLSTSAARRILTIAVTPVFASMLAPTVCRAFATVAPTVDVRVKDVPRREIQSQVERGEADVGFGIFLKPAAGIELQALMKFQLVYIAPAGTLPQQFTRGKTDGMRSIPWSKIPELPLVALSLETPVQEVVEECLREAGVVRDVRQTCNSMHTVLAMVSAGIGATILPSMVMASCPRDKFDVARLTGPAKHLQFYQITKKGHQLSPAAGPFSKTLVEEVRQICAAQPLR